ncbi:hypothetical protein CICLE_v10010489mg, partial [Citrus x clementina]
MGTLPVMLHLRSLSMLWLLVFFSFATSFTAFENWDDDIPSVVYTYNRFAEIQEKCGSVLSSASELKPDDNRSSRIKEELSFVNGDWEQDSGGAPLMPFDDKEMHRSPAGPGSFLKLASFWVVDVDPVRRTRNMVSLSGIMEIGVTARQPFSYRPGWSPKFRKDPGLSSMTILFEGVYIESEENGGEWLICLLGTSMMPRTNQFLPSWELADMYGYKFGEHHQPPLIQDDQIMLVLRYNRTFSLTTGNITGEMKSLHEKSDFKYFDGVHLSSHLGLHSKYQFGAEELLSKACSPYPYQDSLVDEEVILFKDDNICDTLHRYVSRGMFDIMPSWKSVGSNDDANKLGPFILNGTAKDMDSGSNYFRLNVQNLRCSQGIDENNSNYARVFALFRVIQSWEDEYTSADRTGLSGLTLSAEGIWRSSEGQLCMVGCLGVVETSSQRCNSRICLHFPLTFSITQGTTVFGTITSISDTDSQTPLWFEKKTPPDHITSPNKRSKEDPLYFNPVSLKANQIHYDKQLTNMVLRKTFEDILRVLLLIIAIVCTGSQLQYINHCIDPFSYISLVMIYIPAVDYISPLISNGEIFFKWKSFHAHRNQSYEMMNYDRFRFLGYVIKVLSLYALWLTSNLGKKVSATRVRQMGHGLKQQSRLPNEKKIVLITCAVHVFGFLVTHVIREMNAVETVPAPDKFVNERSKLLEWLKELDAYLLLVPDFFLLPQIVGNVLWGNKGKPLRKFYYMGLTCLRVLLHIYDYVRDPVLLENYYGGFDRQKKSLDLNSKFGNIAVAVIAILLAMTVYKQQK